MDDILAKVIILVRLAVPQVTTYAATLKAWTDIVQIRHLLDVHKRKLGIEYEEVGQPCQQGAM